MKLSILIPTVVSRVNTFLPRIIYQLEKQYDNLSEEQKPEVEIVSILDNKSIMLGDKRNYLIDIARGDYVVQVDDDDRLADDYIKSLLEAINDRSDVITFKCEVTINGENPKICIYSKDFWGDHNTETYNRLPNHICCIKRDLAKQVEFPSIIYGEDSAFSKKLKPLINTQTFIDKILYYYDYNQNTTETQNFKKTPSRSKVRQIIPTILDLVILSNAKNEHFKNLTLQTIRTAKETSKQYAIRIIVMEQNKDVVYEDVETIHYDLDFNYNAVANLGAKIGDSQYIMIANNDLIFKEDWLFKLLKTNHPVVSPKCPKDVRQRDILENTIGEQVGKHFSGWCFMVKRHVWEQINGFDEDFGFWYADNATVEQLKEKGYIPMIVADSFVEHLGSQTLKTLPENIKKEITHNQKSKFYQKYNENKQD